MTLHSLNSSSIGVLCGTTAGALAGLIFIFPEMANDFTPLQLTVARYLAYGILASLLLLPRLGSLRTNLAPRDFAILAGLAVTGNTLYYMFLTSAVQFAGIALTSLVHGFVPVIVTVVGSRDHDAVAIKRLIPSIVLCVAGIICIAWQALTPSSAGFVLEQIIGFLCAVGALASWSIYAVWNSRSLTRRPHVSAYDWNLLVGAATGIQSILLLPLAFLSGPTNHSQFAWIQFGLAAVTVAICCSIIGNALWNKMSRLLPLTLAGQMFLSETIFALIFGLLWDQRWPTQLEAIALALVVASVLSCIHAHRPTCSQIASHA